jgi:hypothetical protein
MGEVVTGKFEPDIDKLAEELQASVHNLDQLRAVMVRIRGDHGSEVLYKAACHASRGLMRGVVAAMDTLDNLHWAIGTEIGPHAVGSLQINSQVSRDSFRPEHPPRSRLDLMIPDDRS